MPRPKKPEIIPSAEDKTEALPEVTWVSMVRTPKGWAVLQCRTKGTQIISQDVVLEPTARLAAEHGIKTAVVRTFIYPAMGGA